MKHLRILLFALALGFVACETNELDGILEENSLDEASLSTAVSLEASIEEADDVLDDIAMYSGYFFGVRGGIYGKNKDRCGNSGFFRECADAEVEETDNSITVTLTFNGECEDENGNAITGTIVKTETYTSTSSENTLTVTDLSINGYIINGTKTFTWTESNDNGNPQMSGTVEITVETSEGTISKSGNRTVEITEGADTDTWVDNVKTITGSFSYHGFERSFSMEITTPLVKPAACKFIVSGVKTYTTAEGTTTLDYGDGTCDGFATLTLPDGTQEEVILGKKRRDKSDDDESDDDDEDDDDDDDGVEVDPSDLPESIHSYIEANYPDASIVKAEKYSNKYEVKLDNDIELYFDLEGNFLSDDDEDDDFKGCVLITECGEVEFEDASELEASSSLADGIYVITVTNMNGDIVYEEECAEGGEVSIECSETSTEG